MCKGQRCCCLSKTCHRCRSCYCHPQTKLENIGEALDGQDQSMEVSAVRHMPERGQRALDGFLSQAPQPTAAAAAQPAEAAVQQRPAQQAQPPPPQQVSCWVRFI